ncbi:MAG: hypothetical protein COB66_06195 [Coxiella sp. (in: Bacteria)]|nr:MAG: hypothetical protein COB66_06195 [Coxiella sp. (in: g-proteobacteria)]
MTHIFTYQSLGILAAIAIACALIPVYLRVLKSKNLQSITTTRLILLVIGSGLWIMYGFRDSSPGIVLLATFSFAMTSILFAIKLRSNKTS